HRKQIKTRQAPTTPLIFGSAPSVLDRWWSSRDPPSTERISLTKECGWKDGDRGGLSRMETDSRKEKSEVCLDIDRPSHGRTLSSAFRFTVCHRFVENSTRESGPLPCRCHL